MSDRSPELAELASALSAAQGEFVAIPKDSTNPFFKSKYAGLPQVVLVASPILTKHGLAVSQFIGTDETGADTLTTWLLHKSGQFICDSMRLHLTKNDAQGQGSATTYARRYSYMAVLGLVADLDDDGNQASQQRQHNGSRHASQQLATSEDIQALTAAAKGLKVAQLRMALAACGIEAPQDIKQAFSVVPREKATVLAECLSEMEREPA